MWTTQHIENNAGIVEASTRLIVTQRPYAGSIKTATLIGIIVFALILVFVTWLMAIYLLLSKEKKKLNLWKMKRTSALYHKIEMDKFNVGGDSGGGSVSTNNGRPKGNDHHHHHNEQHGFTTEDDDKYDAISTKEIRRDYNKNSRRSHGDDEGYELSVKLIGGYKHRRAASLDVDSRKESGFSIKSPNRNR